MLTSSTASSFFAHYDHESGRDVLGAAGRAAYTLSGALRNQTEEASFSGPRLTFISPTGCRAEILAASLRVFEAIAQLCNGEDYEWAWSNVAGGLFYLGQFSEAAAAAQRAISSGFRSGFALYISGMCIEASADLATNDIPQSRDDLLRDAAKLYCESNAAQPDEAAKNAFQRIQLKLAPHIWKVGVLRTLQGRSTGRIMAKNISSSPADLGFINEQNEVSRKRSLGDGSVPGLESFDATKRHHSGGSSGDGGSGAVENEFSEQETLLNDKINGAGEEENAECPLCCSNVPLTERLSLRCCESWLHRSCGEAIAAVAGKSHFRCPFCSDGSARFTDSMAIAGIVAPDGESILAQEDSVVGTVESKRCSASVCRCPNGREYESPSSRTTRSEAALKAETWTLRKCYVCGQAWMHEQCDKRKRKAKLVLTSSRELDTWACLDCR